MTPRLDLDALWVALQPIVHLGSGRVLGHEALIRGRPDSPATTPAALAARARREGLERELERRCRSLAFRRGSGALPPDQRLFVNVDMRHPDLPLDPAATGLDPARVAIEISERQSILDDPGALRAVQRWRRQGHVIVLDDYGTGYASLGTLLALQPHMIKVDRSIVADAEHAARHRRALQALVELGHDLGTDIVAEGVETRGQLRVLRELGVSLGQGFLLGPPGPAPGCACPDSLMRETSPAAAAPVPAHGAAAGADPFHDALLSALDRGVYYVDLRRTILHWNAAAESITGFGAAEVVGRNCMASRLSHMSAEGLPLCHGACPLVHTMADGRPRREVVWIRHKEGHRIPASVHTAPVRDADRRIIGAVEVFIPIESEGGGPRRAGEAAGGGDSPAG